MITHQSATFADHYQCPHSVGAQTYRQRRLPLTDTLALLHEAHTFLQLLDQEGDVSASASHHRRCIIEDEIKRSGTYYQTTEELVYGARVAWRNSTRCIGRLHWKSLHVRDQRHLTTADEVFAALLEHIRLATNFGKIRPMMTIFAPQVPGQPGIRIWNPQAIRYAGYSQADGTVLGDPAHLELTSVLCDLGWKGGAQTAFDVLPVVIQMPGEPPRLFELPPEAILEVPLCHPDYPWFADLGLKWHALPLITNMRTEIGGISYSAAPFNGWYLGAEIGARNFGDENRYNILPLIAARMGLDTLTDCTLWKDRALVELNLAVIHAFAQADVMLVDHHTAARQFDWHEKQERKAGRMTPADWSWIVPPLSGSTTPVFHRPYEDVTLTPNIFYQPMPWQDPQESLARQALYGAGAI